MTDQPEPNEKHVTPQKNGGGKGVLVGALLLFFIVIGFGICSTICTVGGVYRTSDPVSALDPPTLKEAKSVFVMQQNAASKGRFLNDDEAETVIKSINTVAASSRGESGQRLRDSATAIKDYRSAMELVVKSGGADLKTMKSESDLDYRIALLDKAGEALRRAKAASSDDQLVELESKALEKVRFQYEFYRKHWGQWTFDKDGKTLFKVDQPELDSFNSAAQDLEFLQAQELRELKDTADRNLAKIRAAEK
jgi:hypothetical protein